ncbi:MAG: hypothetical protein R3C60_03530 [Parvularculaceae bacterium]
MSARPEVLMQITITRGERDDLIEMLRKDGSRAETRLPKKGPIPHDAVHFVIERALGFRNAFWGAVAGGRHPEEIAAIAAAAGHPSAKRAREPDPAIVEMIQAERLVECFEAEIWGGPGDLETLQSVSDAAMAYSKVPAVMISEDQLQRVRAGLEKLKKDWAATKTGETISFDWPE